MIPSVLITGASKGIGRACVDRLAGRGFRVFAGVRSDEDADRMGQERVVPVRLEVTNPDSIEQAVALVSETVGTDGLQGLVNNAGIVVGGPLEGLPLDDVRHQFDVNVFGVLAVTQAVLPLLRAGTGRLVNVSSINGRVVVPFVAAYAASKFALEAISDGLRMELRHWDIPVTVVQPGAVNTPIWETTSRRAAEVSARMPERAQTLYGAVLKRIAERARVPAHAVHPDVVARVVERALTSPRPKTRYLVGRDARMAAVARFLLPDRVLDRLVLGRRTRR